MRCPRSSDRRAHQAFTLVEIMIAIGIFGMILVAIYASWSAILRGTKIAQDAATEAQRARIAMRCLEDALISSQLYVENAKHYAFFADTSKDFAYLSVAARLPQSFPGGGYFRGQNVRRVDFSVEASEQGGNQLVLRQRPLLSATNAAEDLSYSIPLAPDVSLFTLEFWESGRGEWVKDWFLTNQLPKLVRVTLGFGRANQHFSRPREIFTRDVALAAMAIPVEFQMGTAVGGGLNTRTNLLNRQPGAAPNPTPPPGGGGRVIR